MYLSKLRKIGTKDGRKQDALNEHYLAKTIRKIQLSKEQGSESSLRSQEFNEKSSVPTEYELILVVAAKDTVGFLLPLDSRV